MGNVSGDLAEDEIQLERVLGIKWNLGKDVFKFVVSINLHPMKKKARSGPPLTKEKLMMSPPSVITRRQYYSQVQALFDPTGFLAPVLLRGKILLRKTWEVPNNELGWDDCLPPDLMKEMIDFFIELHELEDLEYLTG